MNVATTDSWGTIFHLFTYMYFYRNGILSYMLFLLFALGSFFVSLLPSWVLTSYISSCSVILGHLRL